LPPLQLPASRISFTALPSHLTGSARKASQDLKLLHPERLNLYSLRLKPLLGRAKGDVQLQFKKASTQLDRVEINHIKTWQPTEFLAKRFGLGSILHKHGDEEKQDEHPEDERPEDMHTKDEGESQPNDSDTQLTEDYAAVATAKDLRPDLASDDQF
jgi:hypothetical protein